MHRVATMWGAERSSVRWARSRPPRPALPVPGPVRTAGAKRRCVIPGRRRSGRSLRSGRGIELVRWAIACMLVVLAGPALASAYEVRLDAAACRPLAAPLAASLGPDWSALAAYVQSCPVAGPDGRTALSVDIVRLDQAYAAHRFNRNPGQHVPDPVIRDTTGQPIGTLPEGFPVDPPGKLRVTFADWDGGRPRRIELYEAGQSAVSPERLPPMHWDVRIHAYH